MEINNLLLHPALNPLQADLVEELLLPVPLLHDLAGLIGVTPAACRNKVVTVAGTRLKTWNYVVKGCGGLFAIPALRVPGFVDGLSKTSFR